MLKILRALLGLVVIVAVLAAAALGFRAWRQHVRAPAVAIESVDGVDEGAFVKIGGIDQWVTIRGRDRAAPVILEVHGGPGWALSPFLPSRLEQDFVVVSWDQRGAGKTYGRSGPVGAGVTLDRIAQDGVEVAQYARARLRADKMILLGSAWGGSVGAAMAQARPELFHAYVAVSPVIDSEAGEKLAYADVLAKAQARHDALGIRALQWVGPPPYADLRGSAVRRHLAKAYEPGSPGSVHLLDKVATAPRYTLRDVWNWLAGFFSSQSYFRGPAGQVDLFARGTDFAVPVFVFQGDDDDETPAALTAAWYERIAAPRKTYVLVARAGHHAALTRPDLFTDMMLNRVRPLTAPQTGPTVLPTAKAG